MKRDHGSGNPREDWWFWPEQEGATHITSVSTLLKISVQIEDQSVPIDINMGAGLSLVSEATYRDKWPNKSLEQNSKKFTHIQERHICNREQDSECDPQVPCG